MIYMHFVHHIVDGMVSSVQIHDVRDPEIRAQFRRGAEKATGVLCGGRYRKRCQVGKDNKESTRGMAVEFTQASQAFEPGPYLGSTV